jgi:hypothetical protein
MRAPRFEKFDTVKVSKPYHGHDTFLGMTGEVQGVIPAPAGALVPAGTSGASIRVCFFDSNGALTKDERYFGESELEVHPKPRKFDLTNILG